jgi:hypothetical protein
MQKQEKISIKITASRPLGLEKMKKNEDTQQ